MARIRQYQSLVLWIKATSDLAPFASGSSNEGGLPSQREEAQKVCSLYKERPPLMDSEATKDVAEKEPGRYDYILYATHREMVPEFSFKRDTPLKCFVFLL